MGEKNSNQYEYKDLSANNNPQVILMGKGLQVEEFTRVWVPIKCVAQANIIYSNVDFADANQIPITLSFWLLGMLYFSCQQLVNGKFGGKDLSQISETAVKSSSEMALLSKLGCITLDVTGTLIAYKGELGDYYCMAAKSVGLPCPDYKRVHEGFKLAYSDMAKKYPCFGHAAKMPNIVWWKTCVRDSFVRAGYDYDEETFEKIFRRIYSTFGSAAPYTGFPDSQPFLRWIHENSLKVGLVSNAEYRYKDVILPALGLNEFALGSEKLTVGPMSYTRIEWDFGVFSGLEGVEKPDPRLYEIALERAGIIAPEEALHIGDSMHKDYLPAKSSGMHALLMLIIGRSPARLFSLTLWLHRHGWLLKI
ncbi:hypothetical protein TEA_017269 [Camellia sinensis var. sinensis]|uniref:Haloacid dehalogenase-like hydrolase domain-containing protein 3 n=1 Tax=Camellia sinensis var. sinensis TaxID=542762 RepID=A0A4S4DCS0_CAMSN|nr:hypothetical protein TEA_017269 [Camellia sinensis var. sinensis]